MKARIQNNSIILTEFGTLISTSQGIYEINFEFDSSWESYTTKKAVFRISDSKTEALIVNNKCLIPDPSLQYTGTLFIGVYGTKGSIETGDFKKRPTVWSSGVSIIEGVGRGIDDSSLPTEDEFYQAVKQFNDLSSKALEQNQKYVDSTFAPVIKNKASGSVISLNDVSPISHVLSTKVESANLIPYPYVDTTKTLNGVTFTDNGDGTITVNGTATARTYFEFKKLASSRIPVGGKKIYLGELPKSEGNTSSNWKYRIVSMFGVYGKDTNINYNCYSGKFVVREKAVGDIATMYFDAKEGSVFKNFLIKPIISFYDVPYTPYVSDLTTATVTVNGTPYTPLADGTVPNVKSVSPNMTLIGSEGITIDTEYNADTKLYIDNKFKELAQMNAQTQALALER